MMVNFHALLSTTKVFSCILANCDVPFYNFENAMVKNAVHSLNFALFNYPYKHKELNLKNYKDASKHRAVHQEQVCS